jgi:hypothetical protein
MKTHQSDILKDEAKHFDKTWMAQLQDVPQVLLDRF